MKVTNRFNIDVTKYTIGLLEGHITQQEFELLCMILKSQSKSLLPSQQVLKLEKTPGFNVVWANEYDKDMGLNCDNSLLLYPN